ncbi:hypothetical protein [Helicobacter sp. T3_23-1056]
MRAWLRHAWQSTKEFCHTERSEVSQRFYSSLRANAVSVAIYIHKAQNTHLAI